ncbi:MAG: response regulator, partial [Deltaproteobacteria bacterium]|nr:response regulator [Deltaproteobacteria bacterium]
MSKILIVEDHAESRYLLERLLASRDHHIIAAKDGSEALRLARQNSPEIIISDIMMPVMNGFKLCYEIKRDPVLCRIPFIFYTATFVEKRDEELAMSLGASRFVIKPKEGDEFIKILDNVLNEHRHGTLAVPEASLENEEILLEMYDNILVRKLAETVEKLQNEQRALIQSERRLREAQELAHVGHWELDLKNDSLEWSDEIYRILGVTPGAFEPSYKTLVTMEVVHPDDRGRVAKAHKDSLAKRTPCDIEYRLLFKDGTVKYVNERFQTIFDNNGMPFCSMGTVQDISERREAEEEREKLQAQLNQAQKLESIGILAGGVAHDFNNKLSVILAYTQMAMEDLGESDAIYRDLREVLNAGQSSAEIVRQLLAFARRQTIAPRVLDMNQTVEGMLNMLGRLIGENIELVWQPDMTLWPVKMDPTQIDQILANLCVNARDAITDVGTITISTENVVLEDITVGDTEWVPGSYVLLKVVDDGIGMDKATLENAFEPFF